MLDDDAGDELINANIAQADREKSNKERASGKGFLQDYSGVDDDEFEHPGVAAKKKGVLSKYDDFDAVTGEQKHKEASKFKLGAGGTTNVQAKAKVWCRGYGVSALAAKFIKWSACCS